MIEHLEITDDVPGTFADLLATEIAALDPKAPFRLGASGGSSGQACFQRFARHVRVVFDDVELFYVDERCVEVGSPDANRTVIEDALGETRHRLFGYHPIDCEAGPEPYAALLEESGPFHALQLGFGPDGHTASLFPASPALEAPPGVLVANNVDPSGTNQFERITLTFDAIASAALVVFTVMGKEKAAALRRVADGEPLPAARVQTRRVIWLCDPPAAAELPATLRS